MGYFKPDGLYIEDKSLQSIGVKAFYPIKFFIGYKIEGEEEKVSLTADMLKPFGWHESFEKDKLKVFTKDNKVWYEAVNKNGEIDETWDYDLTTIEEHKFSFKIPDSEKGFIPIGRPEIVQMLLRISQLQIHKAERYKFICGKEKIQLEVRDPGRYVRVLSPVKQVKLSELVLAVPGVQLESITELFSGEVWLTLYEQGVVFSQKTKESSLTYLLSPYSEA